VIDADANRGERRDELGEGKEGPSRSRKQEVGYSRGAIAGGDTEHAVVVGPRQDRHHCSQAVAEQTDRTSVALPCEIDRVSRVTSELVEDPGSSSPAASAVSLKVEAQGVEARSREMCGQWLVLEGVKSQPAQQDEGRCVVGAVPQSSVEVQLSRREADRLGISLHGHASRRAP